MRHDDGKTFLAIYGTLARLGYYVTYKVLDAQEYGGAPQKRERIFIAAFESYEACGRFRFPEPMPRTLCLNDCLKRTAKQEKPYYYTSENYLYGQLERIVTDREALYLITDGGVSAKKYYIASALKANMGTFPDRIPVLRDDYGVRKLTEDECLALQGFPKDFSFPNDITREAKYKQAGNTVCVPVVERIAEKIAEALT
jgi:DNA (cytosine-5)-methyltransferase 1